MELARRTDVCTRGLEHEGLLHWLAIGIARFENHPGVNTFYF